jgi:hypothetical protein
MEINPSIPQPFKVTKESIIKKTYLSENLPLPFDKLMAVSPVERPLFAKSRKMRDSLL